MKTKTRFNWKKLMAHSAIAVAGVAVAGVAVASTAGGPFSTMSTFINTYFLPGVGAIGVAGGIGYAAIHGFKHDYGKAVVGAGVATGGGIVINNSSWFASKAGVSAATIGAHLPLAVLTLHAIGL
ncbi:hypothetical protein A6M27_02730 [Acidithiobacillus thiooxidans]|uniref:Uncharacterized protein n=1 Tax=Acidithiobacillus thiooxidans TaxID=930 RepID=A0A1C2I8P3_ACITH|nr:hypothetical protein [Acidithiobacillus thiooxidans]OCX72300.1 hypothetical protein A6O24_14260 [Acidithiobacillus thiooxidans]OCX76265.1 hypothetical protein A6P07_02920 [Acidithiobacillus thiooxidans]OCX78483.1 hypothetical protein A6O26_18040 [Acidithiobacillus thiooxidans]OCX89264.1 hypothetical protein A6M27_02730 [Acidithiobacillus thiooxidans]OFC42621.1 hypothetical protein BAE47_14830 [Acidithiobacillus thiooxidans]